MDGGLAQIIGGDPVALVAVLASLAVFAWAFLVIRRLTRDELAARRRAGELEVRLNETEAAIAAEAHVLVIWRGREGAPVRVMGSMHGAANVPASAEDILRFPAWLEHDSVDALSAAIKALRSAGTPFNIGVRTKSNELLEADGRTAGGAAMLRFRPLAGERRQITELAYDASKLGKQVERLSAVLDASPMPVWLRGPDGRLVWVNRAYVKAVEAPHSDAVLKAGLEIANDAKMDRAQANPKTGFAGRVHAVIAGAMRALNIHEIDLADGKAGFAVDMSALEEAEKELDRHIKAHASTLDKLDTAIAIFGPDQRLRFHNAAYAALWPIDGKWLETRPSDGEILDRLRSQRCIPEQANYREWRAKQLSAYTTLEMRETWWYLPDGRSLHVICEQHPFGGVTYLYENATKEIQLESRYNELIGVQRETLDNLEEGVALFGSDGRLKLFNPVFAQFWNFEIAMLEQEPHIDSLAKRGGQADAAVSAWEEVKAGVTYLDTERSPVNGKLLTSERVLQYATVPLPDGNTLLTFSDISASARMERALRDRADALEAADRLKNMFLSNVSYEIRTPLTSVLGFAEGLQMGIAGPLSAKQREYVLDIRKSSEELKNIIDAIIDLSAIDAGALELNLEQIDVSALLQSVAEKLSGAIEHRDLTLNIEIAENVATFVADRQRIEQIMSNLLSNAVGFSKPGATIKMGARRAGATMQVWVSDSGRGIEPEFQKQAFDRFQSRPVPGGHRGPGLGLAIVKSFVELHDGNVSLLSKINHGTTVLCTFPVDGPRARERLQASPNDARKIA
ncbi:MAG TPA: ATP-binding protein [Aestuariivirga sp.]|nr:ATP-binding protein [Aestuariivirga sp.]